MNFLIGILAGAVIGLVIRNVKLNRRLAQAKACSCSSDGPRIDPTITTIELVEEVQRRTDFLVICWGWDRGDMPDGAGVKVEMGKRIVGKSGLVSGAMREIREMYREIRQDRKGD